jgi:protein CpxP
MASAQDTPQPDQSQMKEKRDGRRGMRMHRGGRHGMFGLHGVDLTDAQKQQIKSIMDSNKPDQATMEEMKTLGQAKRYGTQTGDQQTRLKALRDQGRAKRESIHQQILSILTPEQREKLEAQKKENRERWEQRKQMREQNKQAAPDKPADN